MRRCVFAALFFSAAACPTHREYIAQIHVDPRAARRLDWLAQRSPPGGAVKATPARAHVMKEGEQLRGPNAVGRPGDLVLENEEVVFVVDRLGSGWGFAESGGNVIDAADAHARLDELGQIFTFFGTFPRQGVYRTLASGASPDGAAWVEARGHELYEPTLAVTTRYTLGAPDRALLLETTLENTAGAAVEVPSLGDAVQWGGAEKVAPGKQLGFTGPSSGPYVGGVGRFTSYALTSTEGAIDGISGGSWTDTAQRKGVRIGPGQKVSFARVFIVGARPDTSSIVAELTQASGQSVGSVSIDLLPGPGEKTVAVPDDARVSVLDASGAEALTIHASGAPPRLEALLPPGHWTLAYAGGGGRAGQDARSVDVVASGEARAELTVTRAAGARVACVDVAGAPLPCKVTFERTDGGRAPEFGPAHIAGAARDQTTAADGVVGVPLAWGAYRITASRGPEYTIAGVDLSLAPGEHAELRLALKRVVDTEGYVACDFHQHTALSADAPVATRDRIVANVAEGVEVAVASEHNAVADLEPIVKDLNLDREVVSIAGDELTSDASRRPWGHANVFPLRFDAGRPRGGSPSLADRAPRDVFDELRRAAPASIVIQINHPRSGTIGYFDRLGFDSSTGVGTAPDYTTAFDAIEVWNGRNVEARRGVLNDYFALLRTAHVVTPTANTDTHGIVGQEAGYPRTYVRVSDDGHLGAWDAARTEDLVHGLKTLRDVVLTNGPMLRVTANGAPIGGVARGSIVEVKVHVESAPWVIVDEVRLLRATGPGDMIQVAEKPTARGGLAADTTFTLRALADDAMVVIASGRAPMSPVLRAGQGEAGAILPWAMTGALWIDADQDGESLGRRPP